MAINRISGNILQDNLQRGANLAFETDLVYIDVVNNRLGVNTTSTTHTLTVNGNTNITGDFSAANVAAGNISATGNVQGNIAVFNDLFVGNVDIGNLISGGNLVVDSVTANLYLSAVGNVIGGNLVTAGTVDAAAVSATGNVDGGNVNATGDVSAIGNVNADSVNANLVASVDITASQTVSATGNVTGGNITTGGAVSATGNVDGGNINTSGDVSAAGNIYAANFFGGNVSLGNLAIANTTITANIADGNITLEPNGAGLVYIDTTTGLVVPVGNTAQQPTGVTGTIRFNTDSTRLEVYDGSGWEDIAANVTNQTTNGDGSTVIFTLDRASTTAATLVMLNGVVQLPTTAYSVSGNTLTFTQAPESTDVIDIRFL